MELRKLGRTGLMVSAIGMGGIPIQRVSVTKAINVVQAAVEQGVNFIDTARGYTDSEFKLGRFLGGYKNRAALFIATKSMARTAEAMAADVEASLQALQVDYIDLYQLHGVKDEATIEQVLAPGGALEALRKARSMGKVRFVGITGHIPSMLVKALRTGEFDTVQFPFNPIETAGSSELLPLAQAMDVGTIAMKPFAGGALKNTEEVLRFILEQGFNTVIPGMEEVSQVSQNLQAGLARRPLSEEDRDRIRAEAAIWQGSFCRRCEYCQPCPQGIDIPNVFLLDGYYTRYGLREWAIDRYQPLPYRASECIQCGQCEERCPYRLPVREMLKKAAEHLE